MVSKVPAFRTLLFMSFIYVLAPWIGGEAFAQAETSNKGHGFGGVFFTFTDADKRFDFNGDRVRVAPRGLDGSISNRFILFQGVYGITNRLEVGVTIPVSLTTEINTVGLNRAGTIEQRNAQASGVANARFDVRYNLVNEPFFLTGRFSVKTPANATELQQTFAAIGAPVDEGTTDYELAGQISKRFGRFRLGGEAGVRFRGTQSDAVVSSDPTSRVRVSISPGNEFIYSFQAAYAVTNRFSVSLVGDGMAGADYNASFRTVFIGDDFARRTVGTADAPAGTVPDFARQSGRQLFKLGPYASVGITPKTYLTGGVQFVAAGQNVPASRVVSFGISRFF